MATSSDIADSLTIEEIPVKLRCASCNKLAQEAVRLPCCDQNICADCQANKLETTCPICYHEPINAEDCRPNKALRQTIKIFLKKKAIDKDNAKKQEAIQKAAAAAPTMPVTPQVDETPSIPPSQIITLPATAQVENIVQQGDVTATSAETAAEQATPPSAIQQDHMKDVPQQSVESPGPQTTPRRSSTTTLDNEGNREKADGNDGTSEQQQQANLMQQNIANSMAQGMGGFGLDGSAMSSMGMGDMMQMMQNGMANPMMAGFPNMMGMPGMGMDPMTMQGMFNNFGGPGMMNGMNMGMGFDAGQGNFGGGFNGQQQGTWNSGGQNKFNQNAFGGGGNYAANAGYGAGYNMPPHQGNFNQMHQPNYPQNDFHQHGYHNQGFPRGRGRGRGGYPYSARGRGNYHQVNQNYNANNAPSSEQIPQGPVRRGSPEYTPMNGETTEASSGKERHEDSIRDEFAPGDAEDRAEEDAVARANDMPANEPDLSENIDVSRSPKDAEETKSQDQAPLAEEETRPVVDQSPVPDHESSTKSQETVLPASTLTLSAMPPPPSPSVPTGPSRQLSAEPPSNAGTQGHGRGREYIPVAQEHNRGLHGRGFTRIPNGEVVNAAPPPHTEKPFAPPTEPKGLGVVGAPTGPKAMRQRSESATNKQDTGFSIVGRASAARASAAGKSTSPTRSRSRTHSPSKHRSSRHQNNRDRSISPSIKKEVDGETPREHHRSYSHKIRDAYEDEVEYKKPKSSRTRDSSLEPSKRSHRSHRDRDYEKEKDKAGRSSHRSHRHRDRGAEDSHQKSSRHRSRSPDRDIKINGANKPRKSSHHHRSHDKEDDYPTSSSSSKRRRSRDEYEEDLDDTERDRHHHHRSKRSKHASHDQTANGDPTNDSTRRSSKISSAPDGLIAPSSMGPAIPTGPKAQTKSDLHALEREKRDRERQMKELQRRAIAGGSTGSSRRPSESISRRPSEGGTGEKAGAGGDSGIRINGAAARRGARKISVRYEDELEDLRR